MLRNNTIDDISAHIGFVYENQDSFIDNFMKMKSSNYDLTEISFNSCEIKVCWWHLDSGQHYTNSYSIESFNTWLESENFDKKFVVTAEMVKQLREKTDETMMNCKKALVACDGNIEEAEKYLRTNQHRFCGLVTYDRRGNE